MTNKPLSARERAARILHETGCRCEAVKYCDCVSLIASEIEQAEREAREEVVKEIAAKQAAIHGDSVVLDGKIVTNEELYKQPTDYVREAYSSGYKAGAEAMREMAAVLVEETEACLKRCQEAGITGNIEPLANVTRRLPLPSATVPGEGKE